MKQKTRTSDTSQDTAPSLQPAQASHLLQIQRDKGKALLANRPITSAAEQTWQTVTHDLLIRAFGPLSPNVNNVMDVGRYAHWFDTPSEVELERQRAEDMQTRLEIMEGLIELLNSTAALTIREAAIAPSRNDDGASRLGNRVFLVHGHHEASIHETARFLEQLDLDVTILREQPNGGRTVIEKFVAFSDVAFAVILLTGDDRGGVFNAPYESQQPRARQNVILELGFFLGRLGRHRVCALYQEGSEIPSDYTGVLFIPLDKNGAWRLPLAREMKAAGMDIDMNKAVCADDKVQAPNDRLRDIGGEK